MPAPTDPGARAAARQRVVDAAITWIYDRSCSFALAELEDAVAELIGIPLDQLEKPE